MKSTVIALLIATLVLGLVNLGANLGLYGGAGEASGGSSDGSGEYLVLNPAQMDNYGFASIAKEDGLEPDENGEVKLPREKIATDPRALRQNMTKRTLKELEAEGWKFVAVTSDFNYIFRK